MDSAYWTRGILSALATLAIAVLSGLGVGSGGLFVIWLTMIEGLNAISARGYNLLFFVFSAGAALVFHALRKRLRARLVIFMAIFASVGTAIGALVGQHISADLLRKLFGALLVVSGGYTLFTKLPSLFEKKSADQAPNDLENRSILHSNDKKT